MRIALFTDIYKPQINGVVNHVSLLKHYLEKWGHQVYLFVPSFGERKIDEANVIRIPGIPLADTGYHLSIRLDRRSRALLTNMDIVHVHHPIISGRFGLYCTKHYKMPLVFTNHSRYDLYAKMYLPLLPAALSETALQTYFNHFSRHCAAFIAPSPSVAQVMKQWGVNGRVRVIPNGIELDHFYAPPSLLTRRDLNVPENAVLAFYVGRLSPEKSLDRLLQIFSRIASQVPDLHLILVGDGSELETLQQLAAQLHMTERVTFTGAVPYTEIPAYLKLADFFVSPSTSEVHPLTFIEAAAAGLPALGIHSPGIIDIIQEGKSGFIAPDDDDAFARLLLHLAQNPELRRTMGQTACQLSHEYAAETNARRVLALYREICAPEISHVPSSMSLPPAASTLSTDGSSAPDIIPPTASSVRLSSVKMSAVSLTADISYSSTRFATGPAPASAESSASIFSAFTSGK